MRVWNSLLIPEDWKRDFKERVLEELQGICDVKDPYRTSMVQLKADLEYSCQSHPDSHLRKIQFLASLERSILGFCQCRGLFEEFEIDFIGVKREYRSQGISRQLMQNVILHCHENSYRKIRLEVAEDNTKAINLYKNFFLKQVGVRKSYYPNGQTALIMERVF